MKDYFTNKRVRFLNQVDDANYYGLKMNEEENTELSDDINYIKNIVKSTDRNGNILTEKLKEFKANYLIPYNSIIAFGEISPEDKSNLMSILITKYSTRHVDKIVNCYTCFGDDEIETMRKRGISLHEDKESSYKCFFEMMIYPKYLCILKFDKDDTLQKRLK